MLSCSINVASLANSWAPYHWTRNHMSIESHIGSTSGQAFQWNSNITTRNEVYLTRVAFAKVVREVFVGRQMNGSIVRHYESTTAGKLTCISPQCRYDLLINVLASNADILLQSRSLRKAVGSACTQRTIPATCYHSRRRAFSIISRDLQCLSWLIFKAGDSWFGVPWNWTTGTGN